MNWWRANRRPEERLPELDPRRKGEDETVPPQKQDRILALQRSVGNQAVLKLLPHGEGEPIPEEARQELEAAFGQDLSEVRLHRDQEGAETTAEADANALTTGRDIYFAAGGYNLGTLAHEVSHVIQQGQTASFLAGEDAILEQQANAASSGVMAGRAAEVPIVAAAPAMQRQPAPGAPQSSLKLPKYSLTLDDFDIDQHALKDKHRKMLDEFAEGLDKIVVANPKAFVMIVGYADAPGTESHNLDVGQERADGVRGYLVGKGVPEYKLRTQTLGEKSPVAATKDFDARNRRVEIVVSEHSFDRGETMAAKSRTQGPLPPLPRPEKKVQHEPPKMPGQEEHEKASEEVKKGDKARKANQHKEPGTSVSDFFGEKAREIARAANLPKWLQDRAESLGRELPAKTLQAIADEIASDGKLSQADKDALDKVIEGASKSKVP